MSSLEGKAPKDTFKDLLQVSNGNAGIDATLRPVSDGEGTPSPLELSSDAVNIAGTFKLGGDAVSAAGKSMATAVDSAAQRALLNAPTALNANVKDVYGAIGDNASHPLSSLLKADGTPLYPTLAAAQVRYPHATSLADEVDWCAIQGAINDTTFGIEIPRGNYLTNRPFVGKSYKFLRGVGNGIYDRGTVIKRTADVPLLTLTGVSIEVNPAFALLSRFSCKDILFDGGDNYGGGFGPSHLRFTSPLWDVAAAYECYMENVRWHSCAGSWIRAKEWWDCRFDNCVFTFGGSQDGSIAGIEFLSGEKSPGFETTNNIYFNGPRFESCPGVIFRASGNNGVDFWFNNTKLESVNYQLDYLMEFRGATGVRFDTTWLYANGSTYAGMRYYATTSAQHVGKGDYSFTIDTGIAFNSAPQGKQLFTRMSMVMIDRDDPTIYMSGRLKTYNPTTGAITITSDFFAGSQTVDVTSWEIAPAHPGLIYIGENSRLVSGTIIGGLSFAQNVPVDQPYALSMVRIDNAEQVDLHLNITEGSARLPQMTFQAYRDTTTAANVSRGAHSFTIETGKLIAAKTMLYIMGRTTNHRSNWMLGRVVAYNPGTGQLDVYVDRIQYGGVPGDNVTGWTITPYVTPLVLQTGVNLDFGSNKKIRITGGSQTYGAPLAQQPNNALNEIDPIYINGFSQDLLRMRNRKTSNEYSFRILNDPTSVADIDNAGSTILANTGRFLFRGFDYERNKETNFWGTTGDGYMTLDAPTIIQGTSKLWFIDGVASTYKQASLVAAREAAPTSGSYTKGDRILNSDPSLGSPTGWVCTAGSYTTGGVFVPAAFQPEGRVGPSFSGSYNDLTNKPTGGAAASGVDTTSVVNLAAIGDSRVFLNHANAGEPFGYRFYNGPINQAVSLTGERFAWKRRYNLGVSGDTAQGVDTRKASVATLMATRPADEEWDLVYMIDINDALANLTAASVLGFFRSSMKYFLNIGVRNIYVIGGVPYPQGYGGETTTQHATRIALIKAYNAGFADFCSTQKTLYFIDSYVAYGAGADVPSQPSTDIHPGFGQAQLIGGNLAPAMIAARGKRTTPAGVSIVKNPTLYGTDGATPDSFFQSAGTNRTLTRNKVNGALNVALDGSSTAAVYNIFCDNQAINDTLMPGDVVQGFLDLQVLAATGPNSGCSLQLKFSDNTFVSANWYSSGYAGYGIASPRQLYATDPYTIPAGKAGITLAPYLNCSAPVGSTLNTDIFEASARRIFASPNAEYSANAAIPAHRRNIRCLTTTATAPFTLTLPPLAFVDDGEAWTFADTQGNAATNAVTIKGNAAELIVDGAAGANTVAISTNYFSRSYRADKGAGAWVRQ